MLTNNAVHSVAHNIHAVLNNVNPTGLQLFCTSIKNVFALKFLIKLIK
jgi:hypothetical protein